MQQLPPDRPLHKHDDMVWDDGVAPEVIFDFEAQQIPAWKTALWFFGGLSLFFFIYQFIKRVWVPENRRLATPREFDEEIMGPALAGLRDPRKS